MRYLLVIFIALSLMSACGSEHKQAPPTPQEPLLKKTKKSDTTTKKSLLKKTGIKAKNYYLSIVGTTEKSLDAIEKYRELLPQFQSLRAVNSDDCSNLKPKLVLFINNIEFDKKSAQQSLVEAKQKVADSYLRQCSAKDNSLVSIQKNYLAPSLTLLPTNTPNWRFEDLETRAITINEENIAILKSRYIPAMLEETEGRNTQLLLLKPQAEKTIPILDHCWNFSDYSIQSDTLLFQCATGSAGLNFIHTVYAYDLRQYKIRFQRDYCRYIRFREDQILCDEEHIDAHGSLQLSEKTLPIPLE